MKTKEQKEDEAVLRQRERDNRTPEQQIERLNQMFGKGVGATKERARLAKTIKIKK